jgi:hypothetical protein
MPIAPYTAAEIELRARLTRPSLLLTEPEAA